MMAAELASALAVMPMRPLASERSKPLRHARPVFLKRENIAARNVRLCFIDEGLCPGEIVAFDLAFGKALVQQREGRLLDGSEVASRNQGAKAGLLIGRKSDGHNSIYHKWPSPGQSKTRPKRSWLSHIIYARKKPVSVKRLAFVHNS